MAAKSSTSQPKATWQDVEANDGMIVAVCRRFFGNDFEDAAQEVRMQAFRKLASFRGDSQFKTWLYRLAFNTCAMQRRASLTPVRANGLSFEDLHENGFDPRDEAPGPERSATARELVDVLTSQPKLHLHIARVQARADGYMLKELADARGVHIGTVKVADCIARRRLKKALARALTI